MYVTCPGRGVDYKVVKVFPLCLVNHLLHSACGKRSPPDSCFGWVNKQADGHKFDSQSYNRFYLGISCLFNHCRLAMLDVKEHWNGRPVNVGIK
ncbi:hypothetical protein SDC9_212504 [bioreactor metagenome]|uniref:Uncharacterized protein n=1 Tax=bioreactor metagenome TaxID=1076179 RepID=A0A645JN11_9ZZZZ